jgi:hypothetical protein
VLIIAQSIPIERGGVILNPTPDQFEENGYKKITYLEKIEPQENEYVIEIYSQENNIIYVGYEIKAIERVWHEPTCTIQIKLTHANNTKLSIEHPEFANTVKYLKLPIFYDENFVYIYANFLNDEDRLILNEFNCITEK